MIRALEIFWLIVVIVSILIGVYETIGNGFGESYIFFIITFVAGIMYSLRRWQRISNTKEEKSDE